MLILISSENKIENEGEIYNELFRCGLHLLHLRKPEVEKDYFLNLLLSIEQQFHSKITLHHHHSLWEEYKIGGIHYPEKHRISLGKKLKLELKTKRKEGLRTSTSIHSVDNFSSSGFDYLFLSPLFDSISKKNYFGQKLNVSVFESEIIGLGGVKESNIKEAQNLGYAGVAVLGSVWKSKNPVQAFRKIKEKYSEAYSTKKASHA